MRPNLSLNIGRLKLKNPVTVASGTFGYGDEFGDFINLKELGALVTKTITLRPRQGNPPPRTCETPCGMLNSVGLENPGVELFISGKLPLLKKIGIPVVVSIASESGPEEFIILARRLDKIKEIAALELNISCPNIQRRADSVQRTGKAKNLNYPLSAIRYPLVSQDPRATYAVVKAVRRVTKKTIITKLSPNVADICEIALAAQQAGSDAVSLVNTLTGLSVDINARRPKIASVTGGLSGPAIRPVAVRMVWQARQKIKIPIIGMGGITDASSALEFLIAGASAVAVGTANFINPRATIEIINGIKRYLMKNKIKDVKEIIGSLKI